MAGYQYFAAIGGSHFIQAMVFSFPQIIATVKSAKKVISKIGNNFGIILQ
jgi:hypothetical protein